MIFPPAMGQLAGENYLQALAGFYSDRCRDRSAWDCCSCFTWK